jgi:hypothetical protein
MVANVVRRHLYSGVLDEELDTLPAGIRAR